MKFDDAKTETMNEALKRHAENGVGMQELEDIRAVNKRLEAMLERQREEHRIEVERMKVGKHFIPRGTIPIVGIRHQRNRRWLHWLENFERPLTVLALLPHQVLTTLKRRHPRTDPMI